MTTVRTPDGRALDVLVDGPENGVPLVFHHGTPGAATQYGPYVKAAAEAGLRLITYSRPGYDTSDPQPGRTVADCAADVVSILDHLGLDGFYSIGASGGGPHSLACAALLPDRCKAAATIAGVGPYGVPGLDFLAGMGPENVEEFGLAVAGAEALQPWLAQAGPHFAAAEVDGMIEAMAGLLPPVDRDALTGEAARYFVDSLRTAVSHGTDGWRDDDLAFVADWGFDLSDIKVPVAVWQGDLDLMVPYAHGRWLTEHIPGVRARLRPGHGHISLSLDAFAEVVADLVEADG
ncbi:alpha/beta fold hydrolase [Hamadaea tsunoensis]|uniref:alpha/beta fold hydrolase n=1 Tax=Hamadaea tsunoensis TaxID=53368 RepID=UPI000402AD79|nr:alpha/beta fold hydrolase [Hamadaea tsunoensis]